MSEPALSARTSFVAFNKTNPAIKTALIAAARELIKLCGECDIHAAYFLAKKRAGIHCSRSWLPAFARELEAECKDIRFTKRPSRYDLEP